MSYKSFAIIKILEDRTTMHTENNPEQTEYKVLWEDGSTEWLKEEDVADHSIQTYYQLKEFNSIIEANTQIPGGYISFKKAFIYGRTSSKDENFNNNSMFASLATQREACFEYCRSRNMKVDMYAYDNGVSGKNFKNINYELGFLTKHLNSQKHILVFYTPDRVGRCAGKCIEYTDNLVKNNVEIFFVKENIMYNKHTFLILKILFIQCLFKLKIYQI